MSLEIGKYIKFALGAVNAPLLNAKVGGRVSPVISPDDGTTLPYVWYYSSGMDETGTKDMVLSDTCTVNIEVVARSYDEMVELLLLVRQAMTDGFSLWQDEEDTPFDVGEQTYSAAAEEYDDVLQAYCRTLIYRIETWLK